MKKNRRLNHPPIKLALAVETLRSLSHNTLVAVRGAGGNDPTEIQTTNGGANCKSQ